MALTFVIGTSGLETRIDTIYNTKKEFFADDEPPANLTWEHVTVADEAAREQWISAKNDWLAAAWTPNQESDEREENARIMAEAEEIMEDLEAAVMPLPTGAAIERFSAKYGALVRVRSLDQFKRRLAVAGPGAHVLLMDAKGYSIEYTVAALEMEEYGYLQRCYHLASWPDKLNAACFILTVEQLAELSARRSANRQKPESN